MKAFSLRTSYTMDYTHHARLLLSQWISFLLLAVPVRSRRTFVELLCACLLSPEGWVTRAISAITGRCHWTNYYKLLQRGQLRTVRLARQLAELIFNVLPERIITLIVDDSLVPRHSTKAPGSDIRHDHANKHNRPNFLLAQCWVSLAVSVCSRSGRKLALPLISRLAPKTGNRNKLIIALALVRAVRNRFNKPVRLLCDAWYMRRRFVGKLLRQNIQVIGQVRIDTALFLLPEPVAGKRGRPRKYGDKLPLEQAMTLPFQELTLTLYGKPQRVRLRSKVVLARFLDGKPVHAVWCQFYLEATQSWSKVRLLIATETGLSAEEIVTIYARRWGIEPLFHDLKRWWGVNNLWQQSRTVLELWMQIRSTAWALVQMLSLTVEQAFPIEHVAPWRAQQPVTAGMVAQWLRKAFWGLSFWSGYDPKSAKFTFPQARQPATEPRLPPD